MPQQTPLQRLTRWLNIACLGLIIGLPLGSLLIWFQWESWGHVLAYRVGLATERIPQSLTMTQTVLGSAVTLIPVGIMIFGLVRLRCLFLSFSRGAIFTTENVRAIRVFAWCVVAIQIVKFLTEGLASMVITMTNPPGQRALVLQLSSDQVLWLFVGLIFVVIAHALEEGHRLADDSAAIV